MGLILSLLVVAVGVIEALSCYHHFQIGLLRLNPIISETSRRRSLFTSSRRKSKGTKHARPIVEEPQEKNFVVKTGKRRVAKSQELRLLQLQHQNLQLHLQLAQTCRRENETEAPVKAAKPNRSISLPEKPLPEKDDFSTIFDDLTKDAADPDFEFDKIYEETKRQYRQQRRLVEKRPSITNIALTLEHASTSASFQVENFAVEDIENSELSQNVTAIQHSVAPIGHEVSTVVQPSVFSKQQPITNKPEYEVNLVMGDGGRLEVILTEATREDYRCNGSRNNVNSESSTGIGHQSIFGSEEIFRVPNEADAISVVPDCPDNAAEVACNNLEVDDDTCDIDGREEYFETKSKLAERHIILNVDEALNPQIHEEGILLTGETSNITFNRGDDFSLEPTLKDYILRNVAVIDTSKEMSTLKEIDECISLHETEQNAAERQAAPLPNKNVIPFLKNLSGEFSEKLCAVPNLEDIAICDTLLLESSSLEGKENVTVHANSLCPEPLISQLKISEPNVIEFTMNSQQLEIVLTSGDISETLLLSSPKKKVDPCEIISLPAQTVPGSEVIISDESVPANVISLEKDVDITLPLEESISCCEQFMCNNECAGNQQPFEEVSDSDTLVAGIVSRKIVDVSSVLCESSEPVSIESRNDREITGKITTPLPIGELFTCNFALIPKSAITPGEICIDKSESIYAIGTNELPVQEISEKSASYGLAEVVSAREKVTSVALSADQGVPTELQEEERFWSNLEFSMLHKNDEKLAVAEPGHQLILCPNNVHALEVDLERDSKHFTADMLFDNPEQGNSTIDHSKNLFINDNKVINEAIIENQSNVRNPTSDFQISIEEGPKILTENENFLIPEGSSKHEVSQESLVIEEREENVKLKQCNETKITPPFSFEENSLMNGSKTNISCMETPSQQESPLLAACAVPMAAKEGSAETGHINNTVSHRKIVNDEKNVPDSSLEPAPHQAFWLIFSGEYTKAMSKDWHSGHFSCWQCDEPLTGQRYVLREEHPYCIKCYESVFANVCEECNKIIGIDSKDLSYKDKHWHEACFLCNKCRVSLVDKQFGSKADKIYCGNCYDAQFASRCDGCGEIFRAGTKKMEYKTRQWHEKCFCCCVCKTAIGTKSFIPREQEIYCSTCYEEKFATRCVKCNKIITSGGVTYKNEPWHRDCFTCTNCNTSLAGQRFTSRDEKPYCADCFGELFAKRCTSCSRPITGIGGTRFISFEDRHWHNDCFICAACKTSLVGRGFITDEDDIICPECAKQRLM